MVTAILSNASENGKCMEQSMSEKNLHFGCIGGFAKGWLRMFILGVINELCRVDEPFVSFLVLHNRNAAIRIDFKKPAPTQGVLPQGSRSDSCKSAGTCEQADKDVRAYHFGLSAKST